MKQRCDFVASLDPYDNDWVHIYYRFYNKLTKQTVIQYVWTMHVDNLSDFCEDAYMELRESNSAHVHVEFTGRLIPR